MNLDELEALLAGLYQIGEAGRGTEKYLDAYNGLAFKAINALPALLRTARAFEAIERHGLGLDKMDNADIGRKPTWAVYYDIGSDKAGSVENPDLATAVLEASAKVES